MDAVFSMNVYTFFPSPERFGACRRSLHFREVSPQHLYVSLGLHLQTIPSLYVPVFFRIVFVGFERNRQGQRDGVSCLTFFCFFPFST